MRRRRSKLPSMWPFHISDYMLIDVIQVIQVILEFSVLRRRSVFVGALYGAVGIPVCVHKHALMYLVRPIKQDTSAQVYVHRQVYQRCHIGHLQTPIDVKEQRIIELLELLMYLVLWALA